MAEEVECRRESMVLYPSPGMGHLVSMVQLAKLLLRRSLAVTIVTVDAPYDTGATAPFIARVSSAHPAISFHRLPSVSLPPTTSPNRETLALDLLRLSNPNLLHFLKGSSPAALVVDFFCAFALDVAAELRVPCYLFFTSGASVLAFFLHLPVLHARTPASFRDLGHAPLHVPGIPLVPADHMPLPLLDRGDPFYVGFLYLTSRFPEAAGIIVNTFAALEPRALEAITAGSCMPDGKPAPPIYCIGPLIASEDGDKKRGAECLSWLGAQPTASVVFLSFGSVGLFSAEQLTEIATGLERSGQRFLWVVRSPKSDDPEARFSAPPEPDLEALLPEGFLARTKERGLVVKSWAPQVEVLGHDSVGGFVTHCGWNSTLEAICAGVPLIAWPLYAEQRMNKVFLVDEMRLAVAIEGYDKELVTAEEVAAKVSWLMESEGGRELRERMVAAKVQAAEALREQGSSDAAFTEFVDRCMSGN